jgi:lysozyme
MIFAELTDISLWQGSGVNWDLLIKSGIVGVFIKATQGISIVDPQFHWNWVNAKNKGMPRGIYHFLDPMQDPILQAKNFINTVRHSMNITGVTKPCELDLVVDVEWAGTLSAQARSDHLHKFVDAVESEFGQLMMIYTRRIFWRDYYYKANSWILPRKLWIAHYYVAVPLLIGLPWQEYTFHQDDDKHKIAGLASPGDHDNYRGTVEQFKEAYKLVSAEPPIPPEPVSLPEGALFRAEVTVSALNVRIGPGTCNIIARPALVRGTVVPIFESISGWGRIDESTEWIFLKYTKEV